MLSPSSATPFPPTKDSYLHSAPTPSLSSFIHSSPYILAPSISSPLLIASNYQFDDDDDDDDNDGIISTSLSGLPSAQNIST